MKLTLLIAAKYPSSGQPQEETTLWKWPCEWQCRDREAGKEEVIFPLPPFPHHLGHQQGFSAQPPSFFFFFPGNICT